VWSGPPQHGARVGAAKGVEEICSPAASGAGGRREARGRGISVALAAGGEWLGGEWLGDEWRGEEWRADEWRADEWLGGEWRGGEWRGDE
jgi:hypothetical protein